MGAGASNAIQGLSVAQFTELRAVYDAARGEGEMSAEAEQQLMHLDTELERLNPGGLKVLRDNGLDPLLVCG